MSGCCGRGEPEWKGLGLVYLDVMVMKEDERGGLWSHYKFAAVLKEALSPSGSEQIVIRQSTYISWFFFSGTKTACTFVTTR